MCELFALNASAAVDVVVSLHELARHGGETGPHRDGWGVGFADGRDFRVFKEARAASGSPWVRCLEEHPVSSPTVLAHIRYATRGALTSENTQPFARECAGHMRLFAHNGDLGHAPLAPIDQQARFRPVGDTDSEAAFCTLLNHSCPDNEPLSIEAFAQFARRAREHGPANFIHAETDRLLVHADRRTQADRSVAPPGLWMLCRHCQGAGALQSPVSISSSAETHVVLFASVPLSAEGWTPLERGTVIEVSAGQIRTRLQLQG